MDDFFWFVIGSVVGALLGVVAAVVFQGPFERAYARFRMWAARRLGKSEQPYDEDLRAAGFRQFVVWSPRRPLDPQLHSTRRDPSALQAQQWFAQEALDEQRQALGDSICGTIACVTRFTVDHGEAGPQSRRFDLLVRPSTYANGIAFQRVLAGETGWAHAESAMDRFGAIDALGLAPPNVFFVVLTLSTADGKTVALRRSSDAVATGRGKWCLGACETMGPIVDQPGRDPDDLFDLARRAAKEELGLDRDRQGDVWFSWFGIGRRHGIFAVAHMATHLRAREAHEHIRLAEANYEADAIAWLDIGGSRLRRLADMADNPDWLSLTPLAARDLLRFHPYLTSQPKRVS